jgi:hypothetical protein
MLVKILSNVRYKFIVPFLICILLIGIYISFEHYSYFDRVKQVKRKMFFCYFKFSVI